VEGTLNRWWGGARKKKRKRNPTKIKKGRKNSNVGVALKYPKRRKGKEKSKKRNKDWSPRGARQLSLSGGTGCGGKSKEMNATQGAKKSVPDWAQRDIQKEPSPRWGLEGKGGKKYRVVVSYAVAGLNKLKGRGEQQR